MSRCVNCLEPELGHEHPLRVEACGHTLVLCADCLRVVAEALEVEA